MNDLMFKVDNIIVHLGIVILVSSGSYEVEWLLVSSGSYEVGVAFSGWEVCWIWNLTKHTALGDLMSHASHHITPLISTNNTANDDCGEKKPTIVGAQRKPQRTEKPRTMSHTMWRRRKAWPETRPVPALPTWQGPRLVTRTPAQVASGQPHQYVTPFAPHTGSGRKQLTRQDGAPPSDMAPQRSATASMPWDRMAGMRRRRRMRADATAESRGEVAIARRRERRTVPEP